MVSVLSFVRIYVRVCVLHLCPLVMGCWLQAVDVCCFVACFSVIVVYCKSVSVVSGVLFPFVVCVCCGL